MDEVRYCFQTLATVLQEGVVFSCLPISEGVFFNCFVVRFLREISFLLTRVIADDLHGAASSTPLVAALSTPLVA